MRFRLNSPDERPWNLRHDAAMRLALGLLLLALAGQGLFWNHTRQVMPELGIVPNVPGERTVKALAFGDDQAFFRLLGLQIQNSGDTFGRFTALYKYDYHKLYLWFSLLSDLDPNSSYIAAMASYYFSQTQNPSDVRYVVQYLDEFTEGRAREKWWWIAQASYLANNRLHDSAWALRLAERLRGVKGIALWAQQLPAFIHEQRGEYADALDIIKGVLADTSQYSQGELNFMKNFIDERLGKMKEMEAELKRIQAHKTQETKGGIKPVPLEGPPPMN